MAFVAPLFSRRARERRAALAALRTQLPGATVELVLPYPLEPIPPAGYRQPQLLAASVDGITVRSFDGAILTTLSWADVPPIPVTFAPEPTMIPIMTIGEHRFLGVHGSGTFGLSPAQLRRAARRIERARP